MELTILLKPVETKITKRRVKKIDQTRALSFTEEANYRKLLSGLLTLSDVKFVVPGEVWEEISVSIGGEEFRDLLLQSQTCHCHSLSLKSLHFCLLENRADRRH